MASDNGVQVSRGSIASAPERLSLQLLERHWLDALVTCLATLPHKPPSSISFSSWGTQGEYRVEEVWENPDIAHTHRNESGPSDKREIMLCIDARDPAA